MFNFKLEGSFLDKPTLTCEGVSVPFESLEAVYYPSKTYEGPEGVEIVPEHTSLHFSLSSKVGNLESHTMYRVRAGVNGALAFEVVAAKTCARCGGAMKEGKCVKCVAPNNSSKEAKTSTKSGLALLVEYAKTN